MKFARPRIIRLVLAALVLPPMLWGAALMVVPTDWAKSRIVSALQGAVGQPVKLGSVSLGAWGGVSLGDLQIGRPDATDGPWLSVAALTVDLNLTQLAAGALTPSDVQVRGLDLRVLRRADGTLEVGDLLAGGDAPEKRTQTADAPAPESAATRFLLENAHVVVIDEPTGTRLEFDGVTARGSRRPGRVELEEMSGGLNGGHFALAAQYDTTAAEPSFEGHLLAKAVRLDGRMRALAYLAPILGDRSASVDGQLDLDLFLRGGGPDGEDLAKSLIGQGRLTLDPVSLDGSPLLAELAMLKALPSHAKVGSVDTKFAIKDGRVTSPELLIRVADVPLKLAGWTDFDGRLDYRLETEALTRRLPGEAREMLRDLPIKLDDLAAIRVTGTLDRLEVSMDGRGLPARAEQRDRLRQFGRELRGRLLR